MKKLLICLFTALLITLMPNAWAQPQIPPTPTSSIYVQDYAGVLKNDTKQQINTISTELAAKTKAQVVVVTVKTVKGSTIEDYALGVLRQWGIGDKKLNNGLLMLIAVDDRQSRIEVGYGLEGILNDAKTGLIQDTYMLPYFKNGDYNAGILNGYLALIQEVAKEYKIDSQVKPIASITKENQLEPSFTFVFLTILFLGIVLLVIYLLLKKGNRGKDKDSDDDSSSGFGGGFGGGSGGGFGGFGGGSGGGGGSGRSW